MRNYNKNVKLDYVSK